MNAKETERNQLFISHCSDDKIIMGRLSALLDKVIDSNKTEVFNSSSVHSGIRSGEDIAELRTKLNDSEVMLAVITDSYERSLKCIAELSSFWYTKKTVIPIVFNKENGKSFLNEIMLGNIISVNVGEASPEVCAQNIVKSLDKKGICFAINTEDATELFAEFFSSVKQNPPVKPFIGSTDDYNAILSYCENYGIKQFKNTSLTSDVLTQKLANSKRLYIISTTGVGMINTLDSVGYLKSALLSGCDIYFVLPNKSSQLCNDVAQIESPNEAKQHQKRLSSEFDNALKYLQSSVNSASSEAKANKTGKVFICCAYTLIRQTITLSVKNDDSVWGWMSVTIPPLRTNSGTPSLEFVGSVNDNTMANIALTHAESLVRVARDRGDIIELRPNTDPIEYFYLEKSNAEEYWQELFNKADYNMLSTLRSRKTGVLIEIAAQHPLIDGKPDEEFRMRLDSGAELYKREKAISPFVKIYVPGSLHKNNGILDAVSLTQAGREYLLSIGIPDGDILGEAENNKYKGEDGVYNSADECFVASSIFLDGNYSKLYCVCSPNQMIRKQLFYFAFGVVPLFCTVPCENPAHNPIYELFEAVPGVIYNDHTWQSADSENAARSREDRKPTEEELKKLNS